MTARDKITDALEMLNQMIADHGDEDAPDVSFALIGLHQLLQEALALLTEEETLAQQDVARKILHRLMETRN